MFPYFVTAVRAVRRVYIYRALFDGLSALTTEKNTGCSTRTTRSCSLIPGSSLDMHTYNPVHLSELPCVYAGPAKLTRWILRIALRTARPGTSVCSWCISPTCKLRMIIGPCANSKHWFTIYRIIFLRCCTTAVLHLRSDSFKGKVQGLGWFLTRFPLKFAENNDAGEIVIWGL